MLSCNFSMGIFGGAGGSGLAPVTSGPGIAHGDFGVRLEELGRIMQRGQRNAGGNGSDDLRRYDDDQFGIGAVLGID